MIKPEDIDDNEGPRSFAHHILTFSEGDLNAECSEELRRLLFNLHEDAMKRSKPSKGSFRLELTIEVSEAGMVGISPSIKTKAPEPKRRSGHMWVTKGGNLTHENPRQTTLPGLREVGGRNENGRDVTVTFETNAKEV